MNASRFLVPLISAAERAAIEAQYADVADAKEKSSSMEAQASVNLLEREMGRAWVQRMAHDTSAPTLNLLKVKGERAGSVISGNPVQRLIRGGMGYDVLNLKMFATFVAEVLASKNAAEFRIRAPQLSELPYWAALHEVRAAAQFTRLGCRIAYPPPKSDRGGKVRKNPDMALWTPDGLALSVECKRANYRPEAVWDRLEVVGLRKLKEGSEQIRDGGVPGIVMVQLVPGDLPTDAQLRHLLELARQRLVQWPTTLLAVFVVDFFEDLQDGTMFTQRHRWYNAYVGNPNRDNVAQTELVWMIENTPEPLSLSIFDL